MESHLHKIMNILVKTRIEGKSINRHTNIIDIFRLAERDDSLYTYNGTTIFCANQTDYNGEPALIMVFSLELATPVGSGAANEVVMDFIKFLERTFTSNYEIKMMRYDAGNGDKHYALVSIIIGVDSITK